MKANFVKELPSMLLIGLVFVISSIVSLVGGIPLSSITSNFNYSVIVILITMELFTNLVVETGIMQFVATKLAVTSRGNLKACLFLFGGMMFLVSAFLNNITAVMIILPVVFVMLKALDVDDKYINIFFAVLLAISNTGGSASPIGDFPALVIMSSKITTFTGYLMRAFPLALFTSIVLVLFWSRFVKDGSLSKDTKHMAVDLLKCRYQNIQVHWKVLVLLGLTMLLMFMAWSFVPQDMVPPEVVAILGYSLGIVIVSANGLRVRQSMSMKSVLTIAAFLFFATVVSVSGVLVTLASYLESSISSPKLLLIVIMLITSIVSGLVSAGPASAAILPVIVNLCNTSFQSQSGWVAIAYAASICAGSSMFLWSATAGFILSNKVDGAGLKYKNKPVKWGVGEYLKYGLVNYTIQMLIAIAVVLVVVK